ncbi:hypothetical protein RM780_22025 [Streptomyces sp. DSM 44917]|uniref:Putative T7SS secretion signal domain-containing protein n=1 Tax=Streptomyces boetiae TaxID=3075541 RepID=A0ABU2LDQ1_9ACTN|nr:hypothetical protein [Streptomyces sp. DSM 44917]MDT0309615.1 hypothetical protein [Streptomyces sp. DSM 44917]
MNDTYPHLGFDPCPGDVSEAGRIAGVMRDVTSQSSGTHAALLAINTDGGSWVGRAADAFGDAFSEVPPHLERAVNALDAASRALQSWVTELETFQSRARSLEEEAAQAQSAVNAAQTALDGMPPDTEGMTDEERTAHEDEAEQGQSRLTTANADLASIRTRAETLNGEFVSAAEDTARRLERAGDAAPPEPGLWDRVAGALESIGDFLADLGEFLLDPAVWRALGDLFSNIAMVLGTICLIIMIFSNPAGWLVGAAFAASALALGFHAAARLGGEDVGWDTLLCDSLGVVGGALGLAAGRVVQAGRTAVNAGRALRISGSGRLFSMDSLRHAVSPSNWSLFGGAGRVWGIGEYFRGVGQTMRGWQLIGLGQGMNWGGSVGGNTAAFTDLFRNFSTPFLAPIDTLGDLWPDEDGSTSSAAAAVNPSERLTAAGDAFISELDRSDVVTAA